MSTNRLSSEQILNEFEIATNSINFNNLTTELNIPSEHAKEIKVLFYIYFTAGALWAQDTLAPGGIVTATNQLDV